MIVEIRAQTKYTYVITVKKATQMAAGQPAFFLYMQQGYVQTAQTLQTRRRRPQASMQQVWIGCNDHGCVRRYKRHTNGHRPYRRGTDGHRPTCSRYELVVIITDACEGRKGIDQTEATQTARGKHAADMVYIY